MWAGLRQTACWAVLFVCSSTALAEDLGRIGPVWPVRERDLAAVIREKLAAKQASGELKTLQDNLRKRARNSVRHPKAVGLPRTETARSFLLDPSVEVPYAITGAKGSLLSPAGRTVNPLKRITLSQRLIFLNADDERQAAWLKREVSKPGRTKIILTGGSPEAVAKRLKQPVYFDQEGALTQELQIQAVPAVVVQEGTLLRIREVLP